MSVPLKSLTRICRGGNRLAPVEINDRCIVLETAELSLVFETVDKETRELIADGFELMCAS